VNSASFSKIFQRNTTSDVVELITDFELLVEQRSIWTQETAHQVALAEVECLKVKWGYIYTWNIRDLIKYIQDRIFYKEMKHVIGILRDVVGKCYCEQ